MALAAWGALAGAVLWAAAPTAAAETAVDALAPGVGYSDFDVPAVKGTTHAHLLTVDLTDPHVGVDLLYPGSVAAPSAVSTMANGRGAVGAVNGDFFNNTENQHPGVEATGASVGPAVADGQELKGAVPGGQRFGPGMPPGVSTEDVFGVGKDGRARVDRLALDGSVRTRSETVPLGGLNRYALPVGSVGAYTSDWGSVSRMRATCGTDTDRAAPCSGDVGEVTVRHGRVVATSDAPGSGSIARGTLVLVGREAGAQWLRKLSVGDPVSERHRMVSARSGIPFRFAVGGFPVLRAGQPLAGLDTRTAAVRTAVGTTADGRRLLLLAVDGANRYRTGLTMAEVAALMRRLGAEEAFNLDGGGSSTLVARQPGTAGVSVRNHPSDGAERLVSNGIGVFARS